MNSNSPNMIYFDNNATTKMSTESLKSMLEWCNRGNPSAGYASAKAARKLMTDFRKYLGDLCGVDVCCEEERDKGLYYSLPPPIRPVYKVLFTSGASEANCMALQGVVDAYAENTGTLPHIILSAIEHKSLIEMAQSYERRTKATITLIQPTYSGHIRPQDVGDAIQPNTCIICVMSANNETGAINDVAAIGKLAHKYNIVYHCDTVQSFGKTPPALHDIDSCCVSFHKFGGPPGIGALIIKQDLLAGYNIQPLIFGTQNEGLRGGTENLPGIGASFIACKLAMTDRALKNARMLSIKKYIIAEIEKIIPTCYYTQYVNRDDTKHISESPDSREIKNLAKTLKSQPPQPRAEIVFLADASPKYLCNTIMLSLVKRRCTTASEYVCNGDMKSALEAKGIVVSVGSACNTASAKASHVLYAMGADNLIRKGALRITLGDLNTMAEAETFVQEFMNVVWDQIEK